MSRDYMKGGLTRLWWIPLITGIVGICFGIWCFISPESSLSVLAYIFTGCVCIAGLLNIIYAAVNARVNNGWGWSLALGILEILAGVWLFTLPENVLVSTFVYAVGIYLIVVAINAICEACIFSSYSPLWMILMFIMLIATIGFAVMFLSTPIVGGVVVWMWIGFSFIFYGLYRIIFAVKIKQLTRYYGRA